ncbi:MAG: efflux RND transporter periplasmic adaptor subunit [Phycisphaerales bacterium]
MFFGYRISWRTCETRVPRVARGLFAVVACALAVVLGACGDDVAFVPPQPPEVGVAPPLIRDVTRYAELSGRTEAVQVVEVRARVEGILLESLAVPGSRVDEGDVLFRIDPERFIAERDAAAARVQRAEAALGMAQVTLDRMRQAMAQDAASELEVLDAEANLDAAEADREVARRELAIKQLSVDYTDVRAPLSGEIEAGAPDIGSLVGGLGSGLLTRIYDTSSVHVWLTVPDRIFMQTVGGSVASGASVSYPIDVATEGDDGYPHRGVIDYIDPAVDTATGTVRIRATVPNPDGALKPGLFVRCRIVAGRIEGAMLVPEVALGSGQFGRYVLVLNGEDVVEARPITLGPRDGALRVIESGLDAQDRVVVRGLLRARPGQRVTAAADTIEPSGRSEQSDSETE